MFEDNQHVSVDRKQSLQELSQNLFARNDKARFWREVRRAKQNGINLIVLVEDGKCKSIKDVANWTPKYGKVSAKSLRDEIYRVHITYGVEFMFCDRRSTARRIVEILQNYSDSQNIADEKSADRRRNFAILPKNPEKKTAD